MVSQAAQGTPNMILILTLGLLGTVAEGAVWRRQAYFNNSQIPFQQQFQGQYPQIPQPPQFPGQQPGQQPFPQFPGQQPGQQPFPTFPGQPGQQPFPSFPGQQPGQQPFPQPPYQGFFPQQQQQQQQKQQQQHFVNDHRDVPVPAPASPPIPIVKLDIQPNLGDGKYQYSYETGNGIQAAEKGSQKAVGEPSEEGTVSEGSYSYTDPDGNLVQVTYTADENGFVPTGTHIPTVPPEILAALEKNAAEEAAQNGGVISPSYNLFFKTSYNRHRYY